VTTYSTSIGQNRSIQKQDIHMTRKYQKWWNMDKKTRWQWTDAENDNKTTIMTFNFKQNEMKRHCTAHRLRNDTTKK